MNKEFKATPQIIAAFLESNTYSDLATKLSEAAFIWRKETKVLKALKMYKELELKAFDLVMATYPELKGKNCYYNSTTKTIYLN